MDRTHSSNNRVSAKSSSNQDFGSSQQVPLPRVFNLSRLNRKPKRYLGQLSKAQTPQSTFNNLQQNLSARTHSRPNRRIRVKCRTSLIMRAPTRHHPPPDLASLPMVPLQPTRRLTQPTLAYRASRRTCPSPLVAPKPTLLCLIRSRRPISRSLILPLQQL
jgi:hypothetical protein